MMTSDFFARAFEFAERCKPTSDLNTLIEDFRSLIRLHRFTASACGAWDNLGQQRTNRFFFNDWPQSWLEMYAAQDFFSADPFVEESRRAMTSFLWSEVEHARPLTPRGKEIYAVGRDYGWREVIGIPIHGPAGYQGLVSLASMDDITLSASDRACIDMVSRVIHERCRKEIGFGLDPGALPKLTARELECMQWVASGKTDWEIGQVLGVSASTAHFHIEGAKKKLGLSSRAEAVARLTLLGFV